nr:MAG TPA_asm: hypothetical protein [Bacteriophage sp.]
MIGKTGIPFFDESFINTERRQAIVSFLVFVRRETVVFLSFILQCALRNFVLQLKPNV